MNHTQLLLTLCCLGAAACAQEKDTARRLGHLRDPDLKESSGLAVSRAQPGVLWTHNDGGGAKRQVLYAIDRAGALISKFPVAGLSMTDWEDLAADDEGNLYLADIGNNDARRDRLFVHRVREPDARGPNIVLRPEASWELRFPSDPFDCESLFVHGGFGYVISKVFNDRAAEIYRFALLPATEPRVLEKVCSLPVTSPVTGADLTPDGALLGLVSKSWAYVFAINGSLADAGTASYTRSATPDKNVEGCAFAADGLLATSESRAIVLFAEPAFVPGKGASR